jgi:hypothetical protein
VAAGGDVFWIGVARVGKTLLQPSTCDRHPVAHAVKNHAAQTPNRPAVLPPPPKNNCSAGCGVMCFHYSECWRTFSLACKTAIGDDYAGMMKEARRSGSLKAGLVRAWFGWMGA